ncbi:protein qua-1-like isoform X2 [Portunus trituberculatus]|uniref:protein qua-1-like isoform X2 n=1 Tax=Portunus trituberculatus TaxID=210409 RepID=UPI001E1CD972|nr:protein qua-1-like isoform X2 [Portunus trituberculatus]
MESELQDNSDENIGTDKGGGRRGGVRGDRGKTGGRGEEKGKRRGQGGGGENQEVGDGGENENWNDDEGNEDLDIGEGGEGKGGHGRSKEGVRRKRLEGEDPTSDRQGRGERGRGEGGHKGEGSANKGERRGRGNGRGEADGGEVGIRGVQGTKQKNKRGEERQTGEGVERDEENGGNEESENKNGDFEHEGKERNENGIRKVNGEKGDRGRGKRFGLEQNERLLKKRESIGARMIGRTKQGRERDKEGTLNGGDNVRKRNRPENVPVKGRTVEETGTRMEGKTLEEYNQNGRNHENLRGEEWEAIYESRIPVRSNSKIWEEGSSVNDSARSGDEREDLKNWRNEYEKRSKGIPRYKRNVNGKEADGSMKGEWRRSKTDLSNSVNTRRNIRTKRRGSHEPIKRRNSDGMTRLPRSRSMGRNNKRRFDDSTERWVKGNHNNNKKIYNNHQTYSGRRGTAEGWTRGRKDDAANWFSDRQSYNRFGGWSKGRDALDSGRGDTGVGTGPHAAGVTDYDAVYRLSYQEALESTRLGSPRQLTRSLSEGTVFRRIANLEKKKTNRKHGLIKRSRSADRIMYAPHKWYYARIARREAKQRALKAEEEARLAKEAGESPPVKPNVEILSLDASLSGPIASLQEGVISDNLSTRLETVLQEKAKAEDKRLKLFNQARELHEKIQRKREKRRQEWWTAWTDERRKGMQLEEKQGSLRRELDALHQRIIGLIMKRQPLVTGVRDEPSRRANYKISIIRLRHEIEDLKRRVEAMHIKVEAEKKLRSHAEQEVKTLRSEVSRKKANMALTQAKSSSLRHLPLLPRDLVAHVADLKNMHDYSRDPVSL